MTRVDAAVAVGLGGMCAGAILCVAFWWFFLGGRDR